jgi:hypothetical protein
MHISVLLARKSVERHSMSQGDSHCELCVPQPVTTTRSHIATAGPAAVHIRAASAAVPESSA